MAELLSHVLHAFVLCTVLGWFVEWLEREWVAVGMVGAVLPDLNRFGAFLGSHVIEAVLGLPFDWGAIHTLGGVLVLSGIGALLFSTRQERVRAYLLLVGGGASHLVVDAVKAWADGANGAYLYPLSWWRNPTPGWYVSADRWMLVAAVGVAVVVLVADRFVVDSADESAT